MKSKFLTVAINLFLAVIVLAVSLVGIAGGKAEAVSFESDSVCYGGDEEVGGVSLMFNVYEGAEIVEKILGILDGYGAKATFFIGGAWADDNIDCVRKIYSAGHELGSHGYFHKDHSKLGYEGNLEEIRPSVKLVEMICGNKINLFAPPSGAFDSNTVSACETLGLKVIMWSRDTIDWRDKDKNLIVSRATKDLKGGEFILMHPKPETAEALGEILDYIGKNGLKTVTVSENLGEK